MVDFPQPWRNTNQGRIVTIREGNEYGRVAERLKAPVSKTGVAHVVTAGSNPAPSAIKAELRGGKFTRMTNKT